MPNIEIHGLQKEKAKYVRRRIFELFIKESYFNDMVVTIYSTIVKDGQNHYRPFLRVVTTSQPHNPEIIEILKSLETDIEFCLLQSFIPAEK